ncbi:CsiV family protein [Candidatus Sororendozoicomonas aggregata]|uniref:CsiV family protein n=1 Tax=Candidatus Sororendozoicomonas aggregata TaxID=3073239 RepID=UPI002ED17A64
MDRIKQCLSMALTLAVCSPLLASTDKQTEDIPWYQVDVIVFLNKTSMNTTTEAWPEPQLHPLPEKAISLTPWDRASEESTDNMGNPHSLIDPQETAFVALPPSSFLLNDEAKRLNQSPDYQVLKQMAWRMPLQFSEQNAQNEQKDQPIRVTTRIDEQSDYMLSGTINVSAQRYLHVDADIWYNQLTSPPDTQELEAFPQALPTVPVSLQPTPSETTPSETTPSLKLQISKSFHLDESRRVTNTQQPQYLDTPVIGILFKLTPYEQPGIKQEKPDERT